MKKILPFKWFIYVSIALCAIALIVFFVLKNVDVSYTYRYLNDEIVSESWHDYIKVGAYIYSAIVVVLMACAIYFVFDAYKKKQEKLWLNLIVSIIFIPIMIGTVIGGSLLVTGMPVDYEVSYYLMSSNEHPVLVCEKYREGECLGEVYQIESDGEAFLLGKFSTENGYRNSESYTFEEYEGGIKVYFAYNSSLRGYIEGEWK